MQTLLSKNMEMAQGFKEISMSMTESLRNFSQSLVPILKAKDNENRKLKRLLSERVAIEGGEEEDVGVYIQPKRKPIIEKPAPKRHFQAPVTRPA